MFVVDGRCLGDVGRFYDHAIKRCHQLGKLIDGLDMGLGVSLIEFFAEKTKGRWGPLLLVGLSYWSDMGLASLSSLQKRCIVFMLNYWKIAKATS
ncbi:hypothetical protein L1887_09453 [Cichorium endivia]|nr:hypothetical protein L1887_09453 [Cichorium endivia]